VTYRGRPYGLLASGWGPYSQWRHVELSAALRGRASIRALADFPLLPEQLRVPVMVGRGSLLADLQIQWRPPVVPPGEWLPGVPCDAVWATSVPCPATWAPTEACHG
jgi:hypothetical protein